MIFERQIAAQAPESVERRQFDPGTEMSGGVIEVRGGVSKPRDRGHKDWGQVINQGFELRSLMTTAQYIGDGDTTLDVSQFGYFTVRATGSSVSIGIAKPSAVPDDQKTPSGKNRHRQRWAFLEIFYPQAATLDFSEDFLFGRSGYRLKGIPTAPADPEATEAPDGGSFSGYVLESMTLDEELAGTEGATPPDNWRAPGTADFFLISYNERTGKAFAVPLAIGVKNAVDPEVPADETTTPEEPEVDPDEPQPPGEGENEYVDPETGAPLIAEPPTAKAGTLYALHLDGISQSLDCGATWLNRSLPSLGALQDIAATTVGIFVLTQDGKVFWSKKFWTEFAEVDTSAVAPKGQIEIRIDNADFESGSIEGWKHTDGDQPSVVQTKQPPQRPESEYYLTRDWRLVNTQPFKISQTVKVPPESVGGFGLALSFDAYCENKDIARVAVYRADYPATVKDTFPISYNGSVYSSEGFATDRDGNLLDLSGEVIPGGNGTLSVVSGGITGVKLAGSGTLNRKIKWTVRTQDGSPYLEPIRLRIYDLDNGSGFQERIIASGLDSFDLLASSVAVVNRADGRTEFVGPYDPSYGETNTARFDIVFTGECEFEIVGTGSSPEVVFGIKGPTGNQGLEDADVALVEATHSESEWKTVTGDYSGLIPPVLRVEIEGKPVDGYADVYIDNIKLFATTTSQSGVVTAIASRPQFLGGVDIYANGAIIAFSGRDEEPEIIEGPGVSATMALNGGAYHRFATDGNGAFVQSIGVLGWKAIGKEGPYVSAVSQPIFVLANSSGSLTDESDKELVKFEENSTLAGDNKRLLAVATSPLGKIKPLVLIPDPLKPVGEYKAQPHNALVGARRTVAADIGRYVGWSVGSKDLFWNDDPKAAWKFGGGLEQPILKIVETR